VTTILAPFELAFFRNGIFVATIAGALCGLIGVYVVLRGLSYIGHGLSHAVFGGAVTASALGFSQLAGAAVWGLASVFLINGVTRRRAIGGDAAIGVVTTGAFAIGVAIISTKRRFTKNPEALLFGNVLGVSAADVLLVLVVTIAAAAAVFLAYRQLLFVTFDSEVAEASGMPVARVEMLFSLLLALSVIATIRVLGVTLIAAALVLPAAVARMLTNSFGRMLTLSVLIGALCGFVGMYLSWYADVASGAFIVLTGAVLFTVVFAFTGPRTRRRLGATHVS
jgi:manganese/iron transport system permease protein/iron/zinc/copper transport system permease protein